MMMMMMMVLSSTRGRAIAQNRPCTEKPALASPHDSTGRGRSAEKKKRDYKTSLLCISID